MYIDIETVMNTTCYFVILLLVIFSYNTMNCDRTQLLIYDVDYSC